MIIRTLFLLSSFAIMSAYSATDSAEIRDILDLPLDRQYMLFGVAKTNPEKKNWRYMLWDSSLCSDAMVPSLRGISYQNIYGNCAKGAEGDPAANARVKAYINALNYVEKEFTSRGKDRELKTLNRDDLCAINGLLLGLPGPTKVRTGTACNVLSGGLLNENDLRDPERVKQLGILTDEEFALVYGDNMSYDSSDIIRALLSPDRSRIHHFMETILPKFFYEPPHDDEMNRMLDDTLEFIHEHADFHRHHPVTLAGYAFARLSAIHPFQDACGRLARLIANVILIKGGCLPVLHSMSLYSQLCPEISRKVRAPVPTYIYAVGLYAAAHDDMKTFLEYCPRGCFSSEQAARFEQGELACEESLYIRFGLAESVVSRAQDMLRLIALECASL